MNKKTKVFIVSHTHHDREWYFPFQGFRFILVRNIDLLLNILEKDPRFRSFTLDAQTIVLEDYLEIRPEKEEELRKWISNRRIFVGPWYVQPDEFLSGPESIVRNLLIGHKIASRFGHIMKVGYVPDTFGHIAQLPQILRGFNIDSFIFTRGVGKEGEDLGVEFKWVAPNGSWVYTRHLLLGYCNSMMLKNEDKFLKSWFKRMKNVLPRTMTNSILAMNGCDHLAPQPEIPEIIDKLRRFFGCNTEIFHSNLEEFVKYFRENAKELKKYRGELRYGKYHPILSGIWSTRLYLKRKKWETEILLNYYAEPILTFIWLLGGTYKSSLLEAAWKLLLKVLPHDSIGGCSIDEVHRECMSRLYASQHLSYQLILDSVRQITTHGEDKILVFNTLNWNRSDFVEVLTPDGEYKVLFNGEEVPYQEVSDDLLQNLFNQKHYPYFKARNSSFRVILLKVNDIPQNGIRVYSIVKGKPNRFISDITTGNYFIENKYVKVIVSPNGSLTIVDKVSGRRLEGLNIFEDGGDAGDEYDYSPPQKDIIYTSEASKASVRIIEKGPLRARMEIKLAIKIPVSLSKDRKSRSTKLVEIPIKINVMIYSNSRRIDFRIDFKNNVKDHRLRIVFPTDIISDRSYADMHYYVAERSISAPKGEGWIQKPVLTNPQLMWVSISDGVKGFTIANRGLPEYEIKAGKDRKLKVYLTILRSVGWLSRNDFITRPYHAGPFIETPEAQCIGENFAEYSLIIHNGNWNESYIDAREFNVPLLGIYVRGLKDNIPSEITFLKYNSKALIQTAFKKSEFSNALIVRFYNTGKKETKAVLSFYKKPKAVWEVNLNEEEKTEINKDLIELLAKGEEIKTVKALF